MKWTLERQIPVAFGSALVLLIALSFLSYLSVSNLLETSRVVRHTRDVISELDNALSDLKDAETGQRGFLITGEEGFLEPYNKANPLIEQRLQRLRKLTEDNPFRRQELTEVDKLITARLVALRRVIELRRQQPTNFVAPLELMNYGKTLMDELRRVIGQMKEEENHLLGEREQRVNTAAERTLLVLPLGSLLAVAVTALAYFTIRRELGRRRKTETQMQSLNRELERSNRELQDFAFVASHDLQEPLRKIQAFGDLLKAQYGDALGAEGADFVGRMQNASRRMHTLINDLLTFSRVTTKGQPFVPVDLDNVAREVLSDLETRIRQTSGQVEIDHLPLIEADATQMRQLLQNLIGNALKFHRPDAPPTIKVEGQIIKATESPTDPILATDHCQITVADNGIGFDEKYLDRIFTPFQRLHGRGEYEGTGMGLAVCRKIVERHGGNITARSKPGQGTTFHVMLPLTHQVANEPARVTPVISNGAQIG